MGYVREYRDGDAEYLAPKLRERDLQEIHAVSGLEPLPALLLCVRVSEVLCTIVGSDERPAGMFGVSPIDEIAGAVWLLGTDELVKPPLRRQFLSEGLRYLDKLHTYRELLCNVVDERNTVHVRWIKWMGFTFIKRHEAYGFEQRPFLEFVRIK